MSREGSIRDSDWIRAILPHRYPMMLVDRVLEIESGRRIRAVKNVTFNEEVFQGHFPGHPVFPGVLILEALAQAGGILVALQVEERESKLLYFAGIERAKFRRPVVPGDQMILECELLTTRRRISKLQGRALVDGKVAAEALFTSALVDR